MAEIKSPFGLDAGVLAKIDWTLALQRVVHNLRTDFIYAPHLGLIYRKAGTELIELLKSDLKKGEFEPGLPVTIEVPKSFRIKVIAPSPPLGPNFSRPGSILPPKDRLLYQVLADNAAPIVDAKTDHSRSFSHRIEKPFSESMFVPTRKCWAQLQKSLAKQSKKKDVHYILKVDIANCFGSLNQHTLINWLNDSGYPKTFSQRLEVMLTTYIGHRSSRGILQGLYPSDLLGNFYLAPVDQFFSDRNIQSARYVDDIYVFVESVSAAARVMRELVPFLRSYDLVLNEAKSLIIPKASLFTIEPDLETLFAEAVEEISSQIEDEDFSADYGFQTEWDEEEEGEEKDVVEEEPLELKATKILFASIPSYPGQEENIERFCLPLFSKASSDFALNHVLDSFRTRPSMSQIYASYLAKFIKLSKVSDSLINLLEDDDLADWSKMWVLAALTQAKPKSDQPVKIALAILKDGNRHEVLRAVAANYVGKYGDHLRRKELTPLYDKVSSYVQATIYYSSRLWPSVERSNAKAMWGAQGILNKLLSAAMSKKSK